MAVSTGYVPRYINQGKKKANTKSPRVGDSGLPWGATPNAWDREEGPRSYQERAKLQIYGSVLPQQGLPTTDTNQGKVILEQGFFRPVDQPTQTYRTVGEWFATKMATEAMAPSCFETSNNLWPYGDKVTKVHGTCDYHDFYMLNRSKVDSARVCRTQNKEEDLRFSKGPFKNVGRNALENQPSFAASAASSGTT